MVVKIAFGQLGSCWGCHQSLLDLHGELLDILPALNIVFWPAVVDTKEKQLEAMPDGSIDVAMIEGHVRTEHDVHLLKLLRKKAKVLITWGACATTGSVTGLANQYPIEECTKRKYVTADSVVDNYAIPSENVPKFLNKVTPNSDIVKVDAWIPGCPPRSTNLKGAVQFLALFFGDKKYPGTSVCSVCEMRGEPCLLNHGKLCFGPITAVAPGIKWTKEKGAVLGEWGISNSPAQPEANNLAKLATSVKELNDKLIKQIVEFATIFLRLPNLGQVHLDANLLEIVGLRKAKLPTKKVMGTDAFDLNLKGMAPLTQSIIDSLPAITKDILGVALYKLYKDDRFKFNETTVCDQCDRKSPDMEIKGYKRDFEGKADDKLCFLNQGYMCVGFLTLSGCGALCVNANMPCSGCYGPPQEVFQDPKKFVDKITGLVKDRSVDDLLNEIKDPSELFYRYSFASSKLSDKIWKGKK